MGASTERFALLLESSGEGIIGLDAQARCTFMNASGAALLGHAPAEMVGRDIAAQLCASGEGDRLAQAVRTGAALREDEARFLRRDGSALAVRFSLHPMADGAGPPGAVLTFADDSARRQAGEERERLYAELRAAHERMRDIFYRAPAFMAVMRGPELVFDIANDRFATLVGRRPLLGRALRTALPEMAGQGFVELLEEVYRSGEAHEGSNVRLLLLSGPGAGALQTYYVDFVYMALREADGSVSGVLVHGVDVTERTRANLLALGQRGALELAVANAPLEDVLDVLARTAEEYAGGTVLAGIQSAGAGDSLRHAAAPSLPQGLREELDALGMAPLGAAGGTAAWRAEAVESAAIATDPLWARCRAAALEAGVRASRALPILSPAGAVLGAFSWYYREGAARDARDDAAMALLANTASLVIGQRHEAAGRQAAEEHSHAILESMSDGFRALDAGWRIAYANGAAERVSGYARAELLGAVFWDLFPEWIGSEHERACRRCRSERVPARLEAWLSAWGRWYEINCFATPAAASPFTCATRASGARPRRKCGAWPPWPSSLRTSSASSPATAAAST
ncbi:PAS domain-containing protein [Massilia sp. Se16.2.3]|uniref:PAS domain-containing protein n=1 Tax=Massilia sp. Se16.2.3 TaxID=2709303 RepID=UPI0035A59758